jgi:hypothetical protein
VNDADVLKVDLRIDIYNSSDIPQRLRQIWVELRSKNKKKDPSVLFPRSLRAVWF